MHVIRNVVATPGDLEPLRAITRTIGRRCVIELEGEIDIATEAAFDAALDRALDDGAAELCVDLTDLTFMDSTGIRALVRTHRRCTELQRRLVVICPPDTATRRLLSVTSLDGVIEVHTTLRAALA